MPSRNSIRGAIRVFISHTATSRALAETIAFDLRQTLGGAISIWHDSDSEDATDCGALSREIDEACGAAVTCLVVPVLARGWARSRLFVETLRAASRALDSTRGGIIAAQAELCDTSQLPGSATIVDFISPRDHDEAMLDLLAELLRYMLDRLDALTEWSDLAALLTDVASDQIRKPASPRKRIPVRRAEAMREPVYSRSARAATHLGATDWQHPLPHRSDTWASTESDIAMPILGQSAPYHSQPSIEETIWESLSSPATFGSDDWINARASECESLLETITGRFSASDPEWGEEQPDQSIVQLIESVVRAMPALLEGRRSDTW